MLIGDLLTKFHSSLMTPSLG